MEKSALANVRARCVRVWVRPMSPLLLACRWVCGSFPWDNLDFSSPIPLTDGPLHIVTDNPLVALRTINYYRIAEVLLGLQCGPHAVPSGCWYWS